MPIGQLLGAGTSILGGFLQRNAAKRAAEQQAAAALQAKTDVTAAGDRGIAGVNTAGGEAAAGIRMSGLEGRDSIMGTLGYLDPYTNAGAKAVDQSSALTEAPVKQFSFDPSTVGMDPGYQFRKAEAEKTQLQNAAAFGNLQSGGFAKAFADRAAQEASQETGKVFDRQKSIFDTNQSAEQDRLKNLTSIMGFGERANDARTAGTEGATKLAFTGEQLAGGHETDAARIAAGLGLQAATTGANYTAGAGTAQAAGTINAGNQTTGILGNFANLASNINWSDIFKPKKPVAAGAAGMLGGINL